MLVGARRKPLKYRMQVPFQNEKRSSSQQSLLQSVRCLEVFMAPDMMTFVWTCPSYYTGDGVTKASIPQNSPLPEGYTS